MRVLVIDIGGSNVKFRVWGERTRGKFTSGKHMTPKLLVKEVLARTAGWKYNVVSIGYPGAVIHGRIAANARNLATGWIGFRFDRHFKKPVQVINDAAMQALGSYRGGRMLFLGLGTGLGSALILDDVVVPLELGELSHSGSKTLAEVLGKKGLRKSGRRAWNRAVHRIVPHLVMAFRTDYVVLGGGNVDRLDRLPAGTRRGSNAKAFIGGARLWGLARVRARPRKHTWVLT
jgi:polyphosphate glucokinase